MFCGCEQLRYIILQIIFIQKQEYKVNRFASWFQLRWIDILLQCIFTTCLAETAHLLSFSHIFSASTYRINSWFSLLGFYFHKENKFLLSLLINKDTFKPNWDMFKVLSSNFVGSLF